MNTRFKKINAFFKTLFDRYHHFLFVLIALSVIIGSMILTG